MESSEQERRADGADAYVPVFIIGAGISGISMAHQLKTKMGIQDLRIVDRLAGVGGTWWSNRYPGVACDVAPWVMPLLEAPFGAENFARYAPALLHYLPILGWVYRYVIHVIVELVWFMLLQKRHIKWRAAMEKSTLHRTHEIIPEKYHGMMTPDYIYGCKRRVFDCGWLGKMNEPNFTLTNRTILSVDANHLTLGAPYSSGEKANNGIVKDRIRADVIVLANGFEGTRFLQPMTVLGRDGVALHDLWRERGGPQAYLGAAIDGFPNFFMCTGPNTANGTASLILTIESITSYIAKMIKPVLRGDVAVVEVKKSAVDIWRDTIQGGLQKTVFTGCTSWCMDENRYISTLYAGSQTGLALRCMFPRDKDWTFTSKTGKKVRRGGGWWAWSLAVLSILMAAGGLLMEGF